MNNPTLTPKREFTLDNGSRHPFCEGFVQQTQAGPEYDCRYAFAPATCEECLFSAPSLHGHIDPRVNPRVNPRRSIFMDQIREAVGPYDVEWVKWTLGDLEHGEKCLYAKCYVTTPARPERRMVMNLRLLDEADDIELDYHGGKDWNILSGKQLWRWLFFQISDELVTKELEAQSPGTMIR